MPEDVGSLPATPRQNPTPPAPNAALLPAGAILHTITLTDEIVRFMPRHQQCPHPTTTHTRSTLSSSPTARLSHAPTTRRRSRRTRLSSLHRPRAALPLGEPAGQIGDVDQAVGAQ